MATTTPVLGLFKPVVGADDDDWGSFWNSNADTLDAAIGAGGPFLPLTGGTVTGPLNYTATGGTTMRSAQDRAAEWLSVRDLGAKLDGITNDTAAFASARTAAVSQATSRGSASGFVRVTGGKMNAFAFPPYATLPVLWQLDGMTYDGMTPVTSFNVGDTFESFFQGQKYISRDDTGMAERPPVMRIDYTGKGSAFGILSVRGSNTDGAGYMWGVSTVLNLSQTGVGQSVGHSAQIVRTSGNSPAFCYYGDFQNNTGLDATVSGSSVGFELDLEHSGPDGASSAFNPGVGGRLHLALNVNPYVPPSWTATHAYAINAVVTPGNGFTYVVQTAGTSGASAPAWPTSTGTVVDGTVTWKFGTTVATKQSRVIDIGTRPNASIGAGINFFGTYHNAPIEMSFATLDTATNPTTAAIRLAANMPIDFSGNGTLAGQNVRTLRYNSTTGALEYKGSSFAGWAVADVGSVTLRTSSAGWSTGNVGRNLLLGNAAALSNPSIAIEAAGGGSIIGIVNSGGTLTLAGMPAYNDTTTAPVKYLDLSAAGGTAYMHWTLNQGVAIGPNIAASATDLSKHIDMYGGSYGLCVTGGFLNYVVGAGNTHSFYVGSASRMSIMSTGMGFNGTAPINKPTGVAVTIAAVHAALVSYGLIAP
jgi:hypothetical protein